MDESSSDGVSAAEPTFLAALTRSATATLRSLFAKSSIRIFAPRRFQSLQLFKGRSGSPLSLSPSYSIREFLKQEGMAGSFQRFALPLAANTVSGTALFSTYSAMEICSHSELERALYPYGPCINLTLPVTAISSVTAGCAHALVACPVDNFLHNLYVTTARSRVQLASSSIWLLNKMNLKMAAYEGIGMQSGAAISTPTPPTAMAVIKDGLKFKRIWHGWKSAIVRDMSGYCAFFLGFECVKAAMTGDMFVKGSDGPRTLTISGTIVAGISGGIGFRIISFPIDWANDFKVAHGKLVERYKKRGEWRRLASCVFGRKKFWGSFGRSVIASMPGAALTFLVYEHARSNID